MNSITLPYNINPNYLPIYWKTEYTANYISKQKTTLLNKSMNTSIQILVPFSQYHILYK